MTRCWRGQLTNLHLFEEVEHNHTHHDDHEGPQCCDHVHRGHAPPLLEEDDGGGQHHRGEEDVVDGVNQLGVEGVQWLVQVVHLSQNTAHWATASGNTVKEQAQVFTAHLCHYGDDESHQEDPGEGVGKHGNIIRHCLTVIKESLLSELLVEARQSTFPQCMSTPYSSAVILFSNLTQDGYVLITWGKG